MAEWIKWALGSARTNKVGSDWTRQLTHTCLYTHASPHTQTHIDTKQHCYHMSALNILYHHLPIHPSLNGNFVFLCGAFWDCCHQHTCYMSLKYTGFTPRRNAASSGLSTHHTLHSDVSREHSQTVFPKHTVRKTSHKAGAPPCTANSSRVLWYSLPGCTVTSRTHGVSWFSILWRWQPRAAYGPWALAQLFGSSYSSPLPTLLWGWWCAHIGRHLQHAQGTCGANPYPSCAPSEYWGSRSLSLSLTIMSSLNLF